MITGQAWFKHGVVAASLMQYNGQSVGQHPATPLNTVTARDRYALVEAQAADWTPAIAAKARRVYEFLVAEGCEGLWMDHEHKLVRIPGTELIVYDIGMRMLVPRELFRANGFHDDYVIDLVGPAGKPLTKTEQTRLAGNVVCPDVAEALVRAALSGPSKRTRVRTFDGAQARLELEAA